MPETIAGRLRARRGTVLPIFLIIYGIALAKGLYLAEFGINLPGVDLMNFTGASRMRAGEVPFLDYQSFFSPIADYLHGSVMQMTGGGIVQTRGLYAFVAALLFPMTFLVSRRVSTTRIAAIIAVSIIFIPFRLDQMFPLTFVMSAYFFAIQFLDRRQIEYAFLAGLSIGVVSLFRWNFAGVVGLSVLTMMALDERTRKSQIGLLRAAGAIAVIPVAVNGVLLFWMWKSSVLEWVVSDMASAFVIKANYHINYFTPSRLLPEIGMTPQTLDALIGWTYLVQIAALVYGVGLAVRGGLANPSKFSTRGALLAGFAVHGLLALFYLRTQFDLGHVMKGAPVLFPLLAAIAAMSNRLIQGLVMSSVVALAAVQLAATAVWVDFNDTSVSFETAGPIRMNSEYVKDSTRIPAETVLAAVDHLQQASPDEPVFVAPYMSLIYYLSDRKNPTRHDNLMYGYLPTPEGEQQLIEEIRRAGVRFVVYDPDNGPDRDGERGMRSYYPELHEFLLSEYRIEEVSGPWLFLSRD